ncbi:hypothetical protein Taro_023629 [Colocasia esculenta]|uniref:Uncharacterized protein n=1 Tax=Colocasia esculenta TaxID=4460 RepID=A0A843V569_COLES|nr:hypothetical protein [Colocasia esculenta]
MPQFTYDGSQNVTTTTPPSYSPRSESLSTVSSKVGVDHREKPSVARSKPPKSRFPSVQS